MVPLPMVMRHELVQDSEQAALAEHDEAVGALLSDRAHEAFRVGVGIGRLDGRQYDPHPRVFNDAAESLRPLGVPVTDEDPVARQEAIDRIGQVTKGRTSAIMGRSYRAPPRPCSGWGWVQYSDTTGLDPAGK
jgi:hypothetical protein